MIPTLIEELADITIHKMEMQTGDAIGPDLLRSLSENTKRAKEAEATVFRMAKRPKDVGHFDVMKQMEMRICLLVFGGARAKVRELLAGNAIADAVREAEGRKPLLPAFREEFGDAERITSRIRTGVVGMIARQALQECFFTRREIMQMQDDGAIPEIEDPGAAAVRDLLVGIGNQSPTIASILEETDTQEIVDQIVEAVERKLKAA